MTSPETIDVKAGGAKTGDGHDGEPRRLRFWIAVLACLAGIAILCGLGHWQMQRLHWKESILRTLDERIHAAPQTLGQVEARFAKGGDVEYWPVIVTGRLLHAGERYFLTTHDGASGWNVFTPLILDDGRAVMINRGFVPYDLRDPSRRPAGLVDGEVSVSGIARNQLAEKPSSMVPDNDPAKNTFFWKNIADLAVGQPLPAGTAILPFIVDAGPAPNPGGWPIGGATVVELPNNHLQYALTWYGLALTLAVMLVVFLVRSRWPKHPAA